MSYLKCLGIFYLVYAILQVMLGIYQISTNRDRPPEQKLLGMIIGLALGGFWLFLLMKLL